MKMFNWSVQDQTLILRVEPFRRQDINISDANPAVVQKAKKEILRFLIKFAQEELESVYAALPKLEMK